VIPLTPVTSTCLSGIAYAPAFETLAVQYAKDDTCVWLFQGITESLLRRFLDAPSKGRFFHDHIRGRFPSWKKCGGCLDRGGKSIHGAWVPCNVCGTEPAAQKASAA
jgi:hypothetical protein